MLVPNFFNLKIGKKSSITGGSSHNSRTCDFVTCKNTKFCQTKAMYLA